MKSVSSDSGENPFDDDPYLLGSENNNAFFADFPDAIEGSSVTQSTASLGADFQRYNAFYAPRATGQLSLRTACKYALHSQFERPFYIWLVLGVYFLISLSVIIYRILFGGEALGLERSIIEIGGFEIVNLTTVLHLSIDIIGFFLLRMTAYQKVSNGRFSISSFCRSSYFLIALALSFIITVVLALPSELFRLLVVWLAPSQLDSSGFVFLSIFPGLASALYTPLVVFWVFSAFDGKGFVSSMSRGFNIGFWCYKKLVFFEICVFFFTCISKSLSYLSMNLILSYFVSYALPFLILPFVALVYAYFYVQVSRTAIFADL